MSAAHPFLPPPELRNQARRLRGRLPAPVTVWTSAGDGRRDGWTISSILVADGEPAELVALIDEDCDWWPLFRGTGLATVNVLGPGQGWVSDVFARLAPSPGGPFRTGTCQFFKAPFHASRPTASKMKERAPTTSKSR